MSNFLDIPDSDDELDHEVCFGGYRGDIVGIRYYRGENINSSTYALEGWPFC